MVSVSTLIITSAIFLLIGGALGALILDLLRRRKGSQSMERRLHDAEENLQSYQHDVASHFAETAELVNNLTDSYREVHEHLANSALKLTTPAISKQILESANTQLLGKEAMRLRAEQVDVPKDWAPKTSGAKGALSEDYGLDKEPGSPEKERAEPDQERETAAGKEPTAQTAEVKPGVEPITGENDTTEAAEGDKKPDDNKKSTV